MISLISFIIVLGVLVLVHEMGHFFAAKARGVRVEKFSLGFGPKLFSLRRGETEYLLSAIPLGGYVRMAGEDPGVPLTGDRGEFLSRSVFDRFLIIVAGPLVNYICAFLIFCVIFMFGNPTMTTEVGALLDKYPAKDSGILVGDKILSVDGRAVRYWEDMTEIIHKHTAGALHIAFERGGEKKELDIQPIVRETKDIFGKEVKVALIGIGPSQKIEKVRYGFFTAIRMGALKLTQLTVMTYKALWSIITGRLSFKESMTGPIGIFMVTGQAAKLGLIYILHLMAVLSASLAIFNLLPLPVLDGGHIFFLIIEKVRRRPLTLKTQENIATVGMWLLIVFTVFIFYNDIIKFGIVDKVGKIFVRH